VWEVVAEEAEAVATALAVWVAAALALTVAEEAGLVVWG
jgi:hypothetical protein